jgi:GxxExxY protein
MANTKHLHRETTQKIIGYAMHVHNVIGDGFKEVIYQRALAVKMEKRGIVVCKIIRNPNLFRSHPVNPENYSDKT